MAITDLTNTTWYVWSGWSASAGYGVFDVNFSYLRPSYTVSTYDTVIYIGYYGYTAQADNIYLPDMSDHITPDEWLVINITGGSDVTNTSLISWLETNGTQLKVTDLKDTTWNVPTGWEAEAGYGEYEINVNYDGTNFYSFYIGYGMTNLVPPTEGLLANSICFGYGTYFDIRSDSSFDVSFEGGIDVTNPKLIAWLSKYGELQGGEEEKTPTLTFDLSQLDLTEGTHSITVVAKADGYSNSAPSNAVEYVVSKPVWNGTDLTGTTWYVPSGWSATSGLGKFNIDWSSETAGSGSIFAVGYNIESFTTYVTEANKITFGSGVPLLAIGNTNEFTVTFTGGTDVTNTSLISWLKQYGTLTSHTMA